MIAMPQRLPYVVWVNSRLVPLSENWLCESIAHAAGKAGYEQWCLSEHVARAIAVYLEEEFPRNTITVPQLQEMLTQSIEKIGFGDVAAHSELVSPRVAISLREIAHQASYELLFFPALRAKIQDAKSYETSNIIFDELRSCVKILDQARRWRLTCDQLRNQIVGFIRDYSAEQFARPMELVII